MKKRAVLVVAIVLAVVFFLLWLGLVLGPGWVQSYLKSAASRQGLAWTHGEVTSLGLSGIGLQDVTLGNPQAPDLVIYGLAGDFSPAELLKKKVGYLRLLGLQLHVDKTDKGLRLRGLEPLFTPATTPAAPLPFDFQCLDILSSAVLFTQGGRTWEIPFNLQLVRDQRPYNYKIRANLLPLGESLHLEGQWDFATNNGQFTLAAPALHPQNILSSLGLLPGFSGSGSLAAEVEITIRSGAMTQVKLKLSGESFTLLGPSGQARVDLDLEAGFSPADRTGQLDLTVGCRALTMNGRFMPVPFQVHLTGKTFPESTNPAVPGIQLAGEYSLTLDPGHLSSFIPGLTMSGSRVLHGQLTAHFPANTLTASLESRLFQVGFSSDPWTFQVPEILLSARCRYDPKNDFSAQGLLHIHSASLKGAGDIHGEGIEVDLPWTWGKGAAPAAAGSFRIPGLAVSGLSLKTISGNLTQEKDRLAFSGQGSLPLPFFGLLFNGFYRLTGPGEPFRLDFQVPKVSLKEAPLLAKIQPALKDLLVSGGIGATGAIFFKDNQVQGQAGLELAGVDIHNPVAGFSLTGLSGRLVLKDLLALRSAPAQRLTFQALAYKTLRVGRGEVVFTLEDPGSLLLEKAELDWLKGKVLAQAVRFSPQEPDFSLTLYCDRLDFDALLNLVVGEDIASGDAEINGIIPLQFSGGYPVFKAGYLYSTPGSEGIFSIKDASLISGGIAIVEEAMKDFRYEWIKVQLTPRGEGLDITAHIKGTPSQKLALVYDGQKKDFVRSPSGERRVDLQGLTLELRFLDIHLKTLLEGGNKVMLLNKPKTQGGKK